jgi:predicted transcriptional regulator
MPELILLIIAVGLTGYIYREYRQQKRQRYISRILALAAKKKEGFVIADAISVTEVSYEETINILNDLVAKGVLQSQLKDNGAIIYKVLD